jgi:hypothetical protein
MREVSGGLPGCFSRVLAAMNIREIGRERGGDEGESDKRMNESQE